MHGVQAGEQIFWPVAAMRAEHPQHPDWTMQQCLSQSVASAQACDQVRPPMHALHMLKVLLHSSNTFHVHRTTMCTLLPGSYG